MPNNELIKFCRYYHGGDKNPYEGKDQNKAMFWLYERHWLQEASQNTPDFSNELTEYLNLGLNDYRYDDGVPLTLKALLYNRYSHWMSADVEAFKEFYENEYYK